MPIPAPAPLPLPHLQLEPVCRPKKRCVDTRPRPLPRLPKMRPCAAGFHSSRWLTWRRGLGAGYAHKMAQALMPTPSVNPPTLTTLTTRHPTQVAQQRTPFHPAHPPCPQLVAAGSGGEGGDDGIFACHRPSPGTRCWRKNHQRWMGSRLIMKHQDPSCRR